jgi:hypothetical protein|nr:hypothetical protein [Ferrimicrobium acidiphilum]
MNLLLLLAGAAMVMYLIGSIVVGSLGFAVVAAVAASASGSMSYASAYVLFYLVYVGATIIVISAGIISGGS